MTIKYALKQAIKKLLQNRRESFDSAYLDAELLLAWVLKKDRTFLYSHSIYQLTTYQLKNYNFFIQRCLTGVPLAYLTKQKEFFGLNFYLDQQVLIPRPETELLVETAIDLIQKNQRKIKTIADIGTGSGCIAITLAKKFQAKRSLKIYAIDISQSALKVAKINAKKHRVLDQIKFLKGNLLLPIKNRDIDLICANLPYLPLRNRKSQKRPNFAKFEPNSSLFSPENGLYYLKQLISQLKASKFQPSWVLLEIDPRLIKRLILVIKSLENFRLTIKNDLAGRDRLVILQKM